VTLKKKDYALVIPGKNESDQISALLFFVFYITYTGSGITFIDTNHFLHHMRRMNIGKSPEINNNHFSMK
jgi:hypothetical protein